MGRVQLFIVQVERDAPAFRASARRIDEEVAGHFDQPQSLLEFLVGPVPRVPVHALQGDALGSDDSP